MKQVYTTTNFLRNAVVISALALLTGFASFSQTVPELVFKNPSRSGTAGAVGTTYKFSDVATGIDALVKITAKSDSYVTLSDIDLTSTGYQNAFQPQTSYKAGVAPAYSTWYMEFSVSFVNSSNNLIPVIVTGFNATTLDIDGDDNRLREQVTLFGLNSYTLESPTSITPSNLTGGKTFTGSYTDYTNINTGATNLMVTTKFLATSTFKMRVGGTTGNASSNKSERMSSIWFKSFSYSNPVSAILPINLMSFNARQNNKAVTLDWATSMEKDFSHFVVQKSTDGQSFRDIATIFSDGSNSTNTKSYSYTDKTENPGTIAYYRLLMIDIDGKYKYSDVRIIRNDKDKNQASVVTYPNPATSELRVTVPDSWQNKKVTYTIYSSTGVVVKQKANGQASQTEILDLSGLNAGIYLIKVENGDQSTTKQFIKQN